MQACLKLTCLAHILYFAYLPNFPLLILNIYVIGDEILAAEARAVRQGHQAAPVGQHGPEQLVRGESQQ